MDSMITQEDAVKAFRTLSSKPKSFKENMDRFGKLCRLLSTYKKSRIPRKLKKQMQKNERKRIEKIQKQSTERTVQFAS